MTDIPQLVLDNPALVVALTLLIAFAVQWQKGLGYADFRFYHQLKCRAFALLDPIARRYGRPLVHTKSYAPDAAEFVRHVHDSPRAISKRISDVFSPHLIATAKRRETPEGKQWAHSQWVQFHGDGSQTEVFLFPEGTGTDVYAHVETAVTDPEGHLTDPQTPGDSLGAFDSAYNDG